MSTDRFHNAPELGVLSLEEHASVDAARGAYLSLKKTFDLWITIGRGLQTLRLKADRMGGRKTFDRLRTQAGLGEKQIPKATVTRLLQILEDLPEVERWRQTLTEKEQYEWASPSAVFKHCTRFKKPKPAGDGDEVGKLSPMAQLKQVNISLQEENHQLKQREDCERFRPNDTPDDIATVMVGMFSQTKAERIARAILKKLKAREFS